MSGHVWWSVLGGGWIHGPVDPVTGELTGDELMYIYPDMEHVLSGTFKRGEMVRTEPTTVADIGEIRQPAAFITLVVLNALQHHLRMFRFLGNCAESKCKQRVDTGPRASSQLSSILDGSHPCVASSSGCLRTVVGPGRPVNRLRRDQISFIFISIFLFLIIHRWRGRAVCGARY